VAGTDRAKNWVSANFTFALNDAYPAPNQDPTSPPPDRVPRKQRIIPPPDRPVSAWDREHWNDVTAGYQVATETYELVPAHVGSKLHCASCHLGAGRDPESAWWVGMFAKYKTPENLYNRIHQCFSRSENGSDICAAGTGRARNSRVVGPVTDQQGNAQRPPAARGDPGGATSGDRAFDDLRLRYFTSTSPARMQPSSPVSAPFSGAQRTDTIAGARESLKPKPVSRIWLEMRGERARDRALWAERVREALGVAHHLWVILPDESKARLTLE
jgi:hypothetical protein